jgi:RNA polymerase sigma factor (TIGR02999 family)
MNDVTQILSHFDSAHADLTPKLFQLVYEELRRMASIKMRSEASDHTCQPTALVHEAFIRLVDRENPQAWNSRGHFFAAAAEAMRRILIESARRKAATKRGGGMVRQAFDDVSSREDDFAARALEINDALDALTEEDPQTAELVKLRLYAGLSITEAADLLGLSRSTAYENWKFARAWFGALLNEEP